MPPRRRPVPYGRKPTEPETFDEDVTPLPDNTDEAIARLWAQRNLGEQVSRLDVALRGITPQVNRLQDEMTQWSGAVKDCIAATDAASERLVSIQSNLSAFFEREWPRLSKTLDSIGESMRDVGNRITKLESCVERIGTAQAAHAGDLVDMRKRVETLELARRDQSVAVEERRRIFSWARAGVVALAAAAGFVAEHVISFLRS